MVDTVIIEYHIAPNKISSIIAPDSYDCWDPSLNGIAVAPYCKLGGKKSIKASLNLSNKRLGIYAPKLTYFKQVTRGGFAHILYIEFSAPKLLYGNNFDESTDADLEELCTKLSAVLGKHGIYLSPADLQQCSVKTIHYGKNFLLEDGVTPTYILQYFNKANVSLKRQEYRARYSDDGIAIYDSTNARSVCGYDKKRELANAKVTEKGRFEKDSWCQTQLLEKLNGVEVLRLELRLKGKEAIRTELEKHNIVVPHELPFRNLFKAEIAQKLLLAQILDMEQRILPILRTESELTQFAEQIVALNPRRHLDTIVRAIAIRALSEEGKTMREIRQLLQISTQGWSAIKAQMNSLHIPPPNEDRLADIKEQLSEFKPLKLEEVKDLSYNKERKEYD